LKNKRKKVFKIIEKASAGASKEKAPFVYEQISIM